LLVGETKRKSLGALARALLGKKFHSFARYYRAVFVDLDAVASVLSEALPHGALVLDVGGGDGAPLNHLLTERPDLEIAMLDVASSVGGAIETRYEAQVSRFPQTALRDYSGPRPDAVLVMDVVHHVPEHDRALFFRDLSVFVRANHVATLVIKDVAPGHVRSVMGWFADRYVSGDKNVRLVSPDSLKLHLSEAFEGKCTITDTALRGLDPPNYCLVLRPVSQSG